MHVLSHVSKCVCSKTLQSRWQALCGSCLWIAIVDFSGRLMMFVLFVCACQTVCKISSEENHKKHTKIQTFYCQKPCLFKVRLPHATNFQKNKLNHLPTFNESKISPIKKTPTAWHKTFVLYFFENVWDQKYIYATGHRFLTLKPLGYHIHRAKQRYNFSILGSS